MTSTVYVLFPDRVRRLAVFDSPLVWEDVTVPGTAVRFRFRPGTGVRWVTSVDTSFPEPKVGPNTIPLYGVFFTPTKTESGDPFVGGLGWVEGVPEEGRTPSHPGSDLPITTLPFVVSHLPRSGRHSSVTGTVGPKSPSSVSYRFKVPPHASSSRLPLSTRRALGGGPAVEDGRVQEYLLMSTRGTHPHVLPVHTCYPHVTSEGPTVVGTSVVYRGSTSTSPPSLSRTSLFRYPDVVSYLGSDCELGLALLGEGRRNRGSTG